MFYSSDNFMKQVLLLAPALGKGNKERGVHSVETKKVGNKKWERNKDLGKGCWDPGEGVKPPDFFLLLGEVGSEDNHHLQAPASRGDGSSKVRQGCYHCAGKHSTESGGRPIWRMCPSKAGSPSSS